MPNWQFLPAQIENTIRMLQSIHQKQEICGSLSNLQVLRPTMKKVLWLAWDATAPELQPMANCSFLVRSGQTETIREEGQGSKRTEVKSVLEKYGTNEHLQANVMETGFYFYILLTHQTNFTHTES